MRTPAIVCALLACAALTHAAETNIVVRVFGVIPGCEVDVASGSVDRDLVDRIDWKEFFKTMGVEWPEGSSVRYSPSGGLLVVANTPRNLEIFDKVMEVDPTIGSQLDIEAHFVAYDPADIEAVAMAAPTGVVNKASLFELRRQGKAELLFAPKVVTQSGAEATVKAVTEYRHPTVLRGRTTPPERNKPYSGPRTGPPPQDADVREVGVILTVLPEVSAEGQFISLALAPETVSSGEERDANMGHPFFDTLSVSTIVSVYNGETVVMSGGTVDRDGTRMVYIFLTARFINPDGTPCVTEELELR